MRRQWPRLEAWLRTHGDIFEWAAPRAGAIALVRYRLPIGSSALVDRVRREQSVLLVPGDMMGAGRSLRFGFGYDIEKTLAGLARVDGILASGARPEVEAPIRDVELPPRLKPVQRSVVPVPLFPFRCSRSLCRCVVPVPSPSPAPARRAGSPTNPRRRILPTMSFMPDTGSDPAPVLLRRDEDGIVTLTLNRPARLNLLSREMLLALQETLDALARDEAARVVVLAGAGRGFCAGHDLAEIQALREAPAIEALFAECGRMMQSLQALPQPVVARVHGVAAAAGCQLVAQCDLAVASEAARFSTPGVTWGFFCSTPGVAVGRNLARKHALEMLLTGEPIDARRALEWGLVNRVVRRKRSTRR